MRNKPKRRKTYNYLIREFTKKVIISRKKNGKCAHCGSKNFLEFHHLDPTVKEGAVGKMWYDGKSKKELLNEINKCILLCHNCHVQEHKNLTK